MKKLLVAVTFFLATTNAHATLKNFIIEFDENSNGSIDWTGTYTVDNGILTAFSALVGDCIVDRRPFQDFVVQNSPFFCTYNVVSTFANDDPDDNDGEPSSIFTSFVPPPIVGFHGGELRLVDGPFGNAFFTGNEFFDRCECRSPEGSRAGRYFTYATVPESPSWRSWALA